MEVLKMEKKIKKIKKTKKTKRITPVYDPSDVEPLGHRLTDQTEEDYWYDPYNEFEVNLND